MRKLIVAGLVAVMGIGAAYAESAAIKERKALLEEMGKATGRLAACCKARFRLMWLR